jgi:hypothetical protein
VDDNQKTICCSVVVVSCHFATVAGVVKVRAVVFICVYVCGGIVLVPNYFQANVEIEVTWWLYLNRACLPFFKAVTCGHTPLFPFLDVYLHNLW